MFSRFVSALVAFLFLVNSTVAVDLRFVSSPHAQTDCLAPSATGVMGLPAILETLGRIADAKLPLNVDLMRQMLLQIPATTEGRRSVMLLNRLLLQPMPGASDAEFVATKVHILDAMGRIKDGMAQPALRAFVYLLEKKINPGLQPLNLGVASQLIWGVGKEVRDVVKEQLPDFPAISDPDLAEHLIGLAKFVRQELYDTGYQPHWCEHVFPGDNLRHWQIFCQSHAPVGKRDLEDAVALSKKEEGRVTLKKIQETGTYDPKKDKMEPGSDPKIHSADRWVELRPNNLGTSFSAADFIWLRDNLLIDDSDNPGKKKIAFDSVTIPKGESPEEVRITSRILRAIEDYNKVPRGTIKMSFLIEDPKSAATAYGFAAADPTVMGGLYGVADWTASTGGRPSAQEKYNGALWGRKRTVEGFHAAVSEWNPRGVDAQDAISVPLTEKDSHENSVQAARTGFDGKWSVHPNHVLGIKRGPWNFHESRVTRKPLGDWSNFEPFDMKELERMAAAGEPLVKRPNYTPKAVVPLRSTTTVSIYESGQIESALGQPLDQLTLDVQALLKNPLALIGVSHSRTALEIPPNAGLVLSSLEALKNANPKTRLALRIDALNLNERELKYLDSFMDIMLSRKYQIRGITLDNVTSPDQIKQLDAFLKNRLEKDPFMRPEIFQVQARITSREMIDHSLLPAEVQIGGKTVKREDVDMYDDAWQGADVKWAVDPKKWLSLEDDRLYSIAKASDYCGALVFAVPGLENDPIAKGHLLAIAKAAEVEAIDGSNVADTKWELIANQAAEIGYRGQEISAVGRAGKAVEIYSPSKDLIVRSLDVTQKYDQADVIGGVGAIGYLRPDGKTEIVDEATAKIDRNVVEVAAVADLFTPDQRTQYLRLLAVLKNIRVPFQIKKMETLFIEELQSILDELKEQDLPAASLSIFNYGDDFNSRQKALLRFAEDLLKARSKVGKLPILILDPKKSDGTVGNLGLGMLVSSVPAEMKSRIVGVNRNEQDKMAYVTFTHDTDYEVAKAVISRLKEEGFDKNHIRIFVDRETYIPQLAADNGAVRELAVEQLMAQAQDFRDVLEAKEGNLYGVDSKKGRYPDRVPYLAASMDVTVTLPESLINPIGKSWGISPVYVRDGVRQLILVSKKGSRLILESPTSKQVDLVQQRGGGISSFEIESLLSFQGDGLDNSRFPDGRSIFYGYKDKKKLAVGQKFPLPAVKLAKGEGDLAQRFPVTRKVIDAMIRGYAGFSEDRNLHHLNEEWAVKTLGSRIAHGMLSSSMGLDRLGAILAEFDEQYTVVSEESSYNAPVPLEGVVSFSAEVVSRYDNGDLKVVVTTTLADGKSGKEVGKNELRLRPSAKKKPSALVQAVTELHRGADSDTQAKYLLDTFGGIGPFEMRPAPAFQVGDEMEYTWEVNDTKLKALAALFEGESWADLLIGKAISAKASSSMAPGSILRASRVIEMLRPIPVGQVLKIRATIVNLRKTSKGDDMLTEHIKIMDAQGNLLLHAEVTKLVQSKYESPRGSTSLRPEPISATEQGLPKTIQPFSLDETVKSGKPADLSKKPWQQQWSDGMPATVRDSGANFVEELEKKIAADSTYPTDEQLMEFLNDLGEKKTKTPKELQADVARMAALLQEEYGVRQGDRVAILLPNSYESRLALLAAMKLGAIAVPLDPAYKDSELEPRLADARPKVVVTDELYYPTVKKSGDKAGVEAYFLTRVQSGLIDEEVKLTGLSLDEHPEIERHVKESAQLLGSKEAEVLDDADLKRLLEEAVEIGMMVKLPDGSYYFRSHPDDVARSVPRTFVATRDPRHAGLNNNWRHTDELVPAVLDKMRNGAKGKKVYAVPYLMGPEKSPFSRVGVEVTDSLYVAIHMILMTKVGKAALETLKVSKDPKAFTRGIHCTGDLNALKEADKYFVAVPEDRLILSFGSAYGGNALFGKKFESLRIAMFNGWKEGWLAEHMALLGIEELGGISGHLGGAFPSLSGKTNFGMMFAPPELEGKVKTTFVSDDIVWHLPKEDGIYAVNSEDGIFGVAPKTNERTNPSFMLAIKNGIAVYTNQAYNPVRAAQGEDPIWWEDKSAPPTDEGWLDWKGAPWKPGAGKVAAHPNSRITFKKVNVPNLSPLAADPAGVRVDAIIGQGRMTEGQPLMLQLPSAVAGIYDLLMMGAETTAAEKGRAEEFRFDSMAMLPFMAYPEWDYIAHWHNIAKQLGDNFPLIGHMNAYRKEGGTKSGEFLHEGYSKNLFLALWLLQRAKKDPRAYGEEDFVETPLGFVPTVKWLKKSGYAMDEKIEKRLEEALSIDKGFWKKMMFLRTLYFSRFGKHLNDEGVVPMRDYHLDLMARLIGEKEAAAAREIFERSAKAGLTPQIWEENLLTVQIVAGREIADAARSVFKDFLNETSFDPEKFVPPAAPAKVGYMSVTALKRAPVGKLRAPQLKNDGSDVAFLQYKAGSEAGVRGIEVTHGNILSAVRRRAEATFPGKWKSQRAKVVYATPEFHTWGSISGVLLPLWAGQGSLTISDLKREGGKPYLDRVYQVLTEENGTHFFGVPTLFAKLRDRLVEAKRVAHCTYEVFVSAAAPLEEALRLSFESLTSGKLIQAYGAKEATVPFAAPVDRPTKPGSVGLPLPDVEILLVDPAVQDRLVPIAPDQKIGELAVCAPQVARGVWNNAPATRDFVQTYAGKPYVRMGDLAFVDEEGWLYVLSRTDDLINVSGNKVYPYEVETVLEQHPAIATAGVVGVAHPEKGNEVVAFVVLKSDAKWDPKAAQEFVARQLSGYKVPVRFMPIETFPWKVTGSKKDRAKLRAMAAQGILGGLPFEEEQKRKAAEAAAAPAAPAVPAALPAATFEELKEGADASLKTVRRLLDIFSTRLAKQSSPDGKAISNDLLDKDQKAAEDYALMESYFASAEQILRFLNERTEIDELHRKLSLGYIGEALGAIRRLMLEKPEAYGLDPEAVWESFQKNRSVSRFFATVTNHNWIETIGEQLFENDIVPGYNLDPKYEEAVMIGDALRQLGNDLIRPQAEKIHREDLLVSEEIITTLGDSGAFGLSIPSQHGGVQEHHNNIPMILGTIELSDASLGAAGSLITRPEITSKVILRAGTEEQKARFLPEIASGKKMMTVLFTEPNFGSDLANIACTAELDEKTNEWVVNGDKQWGTFAGRADWMLILVRTEKENGKFKKGAKALSVLLAEKPRVREDDFEIWEGAKVPELPKLPEGVTKDGETYTYVQPGGGRLQWKQDHTTGYRGMHSYTLKYENYRVPANNLIGERGDGFFLIAKEGLAGGRIQTAGRAIGLMRAAYRETLKNTKARKIFPTKERPNRTVADFGLTKYTLARMAMMIHGAQQFTFRAAELVTEGDVLREQGDEKNAMRGRLEASMAKLLFSKFANDVTRMGQQKHGGMGVAEEYPISRYAVDAQILTIFEGAEEILEVRVVTPEFLRQRLDAIEKERQLKLKQEAEALAIAI